MRRIESKWKLGILEASTHCLKSNSGFVDNCNLSFVPIDLLDFTFTSNTTPPSQIKYKNAIVFGIMPIVLN